MTTEDLAIAPPAPADALNLPPPPLPAPLVVGDAPALASYADLVAQEASSCVPFSQLPDPSATSVHAFPASERFAFVAHVNKVLSEQPDLAGKLPINPTSDAIFDAVKDGVLLCKLINWSVPRTIDENKITKNFRDEKSKMYHQITNHNLCIAGAKKIGAIVINLGAEDLLEGKPYLVFGLLWQIIKIGLLKEVSVEKHPELLQLREGEEDLSNLPPEDLLLKWFNYHLKTVDGMDQVGNFTADITDSTAYIHLMHRMAPEVCTLEALQEPDKVKRAELMLANAEKLGCRTFVTPEDVVAGNEKLNLAFVANMFSKHTGIAPITVTKELEEENAQLKTDNESLRETVDALERKIKYVLQEKASKETEVESLTAETARLSKLVDQSTFEREELALKVHNIFAVNEKLQEQIAEISSEKKEVEQSKQQLSAKYQSVLQSLTATTNELQKERIHLETSEFCGASLANDLEELRSRHEKMEYLIEHLKLERMRSEMHVERLRILYNSFGSTEELCQAIYKSLALDSIAVGASKVGYLTKKARNGSSWKYRFFVLRDNFLFYYKSDKDVKAAPSGAIRVDDAVLRFAENPTRKDLKDQWLLCIEVPNNNESSKQLSFYIAGEDHELEGWKSQIQTAAGWWTKKSSFSTIKSRTAKLASFS